MNWQTELERGITNLKSSDDRLGFLIEKYGLPNYQPHNNYYQELVESIISQQLSVKAAASITTRFVALFGQFPSPEQIVASDFDDLRSAGLSGPKIKYIQDLAAKTMSGEVKFDHLDSLTNDEIIDELTNVKGIGVWTVHMFLMFCMGRLDVLAYGDLGIRNGIMKLYELDSLPDQATIELIADKNKWNPYESLACWYVWRSLENLPK